MKNQEHEKECKCDFCNLTAEEALAKNNDAIKKYGWVAHIIIDETDCPFGMNVHTHGLPETYGHMDLQICFPLPPEDCHAILINAIEEHIKKGVVFEAGKQYANLIQPSPGHEQKEFKVMFLEVEEDKRKLLRMIFPEQDGGFNGKFVNEQMKGCSDRSHIN